MQLEDFDTKNEKSLSSDDNLIPWITLCLENDFGNFELSCGKHEFQFDVKSVWDLNGLFDSFAEKFQFRVFSRNWDALFDWLTDLSSFPQGEDIKLQFRNSDVFFQETGDYRTFLKLSALLNDVGKYWIHAPEIEPQLPWLKRRRFNALFVFKGEPKMFLAQECLRQIGVRYRIASRTR